MHREKDTTMTSNMVSFMMDGILDYLLGLPDHKHKAPQGQVLTTLAEAIVEYPVNVGDPEYHFTSRAVIMLEELDLVKVERKNWHRRERANVLLSITLNEDS